MRGNVYFEFDIVEDLTVTGMLTFQLYQFKPTKIVLSEQEVWRGSGDRQIKPLKKINKLLITIQPGCVQTHLAAV